MDLTEAQQLLSLIMPDRVNAVLVSNVGDPIEGIQYTAAVSDRLRILALEPEGVEQVTAILSRPDVLSVVEEQVAAESDVIPSAFEGLIVSAPG